MEEGEIGDSAIKGKGNKVPRMKEESVMPNAARRCSEISTENVLIGFGDFAFARQFQWTTGNESRTSVG